MATLSQALPRRTIINTVAIFSGEAFSRLATLAMALIVARRFGAEALGQYGYALAFASVLMLVPDGGLHLLTTRELAADPRQLGRVFWSLHWVKLPLVLGVAVFTVLFGELAVRDDGRRLLLYVLVARALLQTFSLAYMAIFKAFEQMHHIALVQFANALLVVTGAALALELQLSVTLVVSAFLLGQAAETLFAWRILQRNFAPGRPTGWDRGLLAGLILAAAPIGLTSLLQAVNLRLDLLILSVFVPNRDLGWFQAAAWFTIGVFLVASLGMTVLFPRLSRLLRPRSAAGPALVAGLLQNALPLATLGSLVMWIGAPWLLRGVFGPALGSADLLLRILVPALPFVFINVILFHVFVAAGCRRAYLVTLAASLAVGCVAGLLLAPRYGALGSAVAALARESTTSVLFLCFLWRERVAADVAKAILKALLAATIACAIMGAVGGTLLPGTVWPLVWSLLAFAGELIFVGLPNREPLTIFADEER